jgi:hypothetical protein
MEEPLITTHAYEALFTCLDKALCNARASGLNPFKLPLNALLGHEFLILHGAVETGVSI